jgi:hypothetical protein
VQYDSGAVDLKVPVLLIDTVESLETFTFANSFDSVGKSEEAVLPIPHLDTQATGSILCFNHDFFTEPLISSRRAA